MKILILFIFRAIFGFSGFTEHNQNLIKSLIKQYSVKNVFLISEEEINLEYYFQSLFYFENALTFNIHTNNENYENVFNNHFLEYELLFITANNSESLKKIQIWHKFIARSSAKLIVVALSNQCECLFLMVSFSANQVIFMSEGNTIKCSKLGDFCDFFTKADEFIRSDPTQSPGLYLPELLIRYKTYSKEDFPLVIGTENPTTGMLVYFTSTFEKYYEDLRNRYIRKKNKRQIHIYVDTTVSGYNNGYPLKFSRMCLMLPIIDEIQQPDFLKKPFNL